VPLDRYGAGIADPGWNFATLSANGRGKCADQKYTCQSLDDILSLPSVNCSLPRSNCRDNNASTATVSSCAKTQ
jgi:hypothetical protein